MLQPDSLLKFVFPSDPQLSPDGGRVAFVLSRIEEEDLDKIDKDFAKPRYKSAVYVSDGGEPRQVTSGEKGDRAPRWSPDGETLLFVSSRSGKPQLHLLPLAGGEARQLTRLKTGASEGQWSPDGTQVAFLSRGDDEDKSNERGEAKVVERLVYKFNGAGFLPVKSAALYVLNVSSGESRLVFQPETSISDFAWKPDGSGFLAIMAKDETAFASWENEVFDIDLQGQVKQVTDWRSGLFSLTIHPSGAKFVATGRPSDKTNVEEGHIFEFDLQGNWKRLDEKVDFPAGNIVAGDCHVGSFPGKPSYVGEDLVSLYTVGGSAGLFALQDGEKVERVYAEGRVVSAFTANANGTAYIQESPSEYPEVFLGGRKITNLAAKLGDFPIRQPVRVTATHSDGTEVEGWVLRNGEENQPAILTVHGGPHTAYGHGFMHEFQLFADRGYAVCYANPRGSVGYGQAFTSAIFGRWGTIDYEDLMAFFDACLSAIPDLDASRTAVMGGSYGGFMTNWVIGHTDRFTCAVTDRSICNLVSFNGTSDIAPRFWRDELGLEYIRSTDIEGLWNMSPLKYVEHVKTPCLIVHSEEDHRCPVEQAEQWFTALKLRGVETLFVRFPGENHELSRSGRPDRRMVRLEHYLRWLDSHLGVGG
ncbi:S9 family peptidase [Deinococcus yavapaiensis]|uniref:Dipeptidyl aminopeptidase/acylaminoacyl peptidase n=1 Tax=Deinococcus yavapaiensis KR-236 TaxID=694435 RepID=A0A318SB27_9DEIO|nr:S9 family peptidase [Deinococcus yavapaiensis]PYE54411.1 dipeptidyl aminopeptidase/acylaminoacyl peptidase [Deinococcus yavapaiensis KR-236]